jgi:hypothetical protein
MSVADDFCVMCEKVFSTRLGRDKAKTFLTPVDVSGMLEQVTRCKNAKIGTC